MPAAPSRGLILPWLNLYINLPSRTPATVSKAIASNPRAKTAMVCHFRKLPPSIAAPILNPSKRVTRLVRVFCATSTSLPITPDSFIKLPNISIPINGAPIGAIRMVTIPATMGKSNFTVLDTFLSPEAINVARSFLVVNARMIGG